MTQVWMSVKALPHWKWENPAYEISPTSENSGIEDNNDCSTDIEEPEYDITYKSYPLVMW